MKYVSTRGLAPPLSFSDVLLAGLAADGGLYVPQSWPTLDAATIAGFAGRPYHEVAATVMRPFVGADIGEAAFASMCAAAYEGFRHPAVTPLVQVAPGAFLLELFHGPTLAFKDVAMQLLARLMDHVLAERGERATVIGATSGDTGGAAVEAFRGRDHVDVFVLFPHGRVSDVQRRQMTSLGDRNVHPVALDGSFDDCQAIVKRLFADQSFRSRAALTGVNSINWARIMAQTVYYFTAAVALGAPARRVSFSVPTGNFGDIFAGHVARRMGLPIDTLVIATNENDILERTLAGGRYELRGVVPTQSPSMDIQVSSNFERLLYEAHGHDGAAVKRLMDGLGQSGAFSLDPQALAAIRDGFAASRVDEAETAAEMRQMWADCAYVADPHTAVGLAAARRHADPAVPMVTLATAHPAKFPDAVAAATGTPPALPPWMGDLMDRTERYDRLPNDAATVKTYISERARAFRAEAHS